MRSRSPICSRTRGVTRSESFFRSKEWSISNCWIKASIHDRCESVRPATAACSCSIVFNDVPLPGPYIRVLWHLHGFRNILHAAIDTQEHLFRSLCWRRSNTDPPTAYNLIRIEIAKAALVVKCEPSDPLRIALHAVIRSHGKLRASMLHLRERLLSLPNEQRPGRKFDRAVKGRPRKYDARVLEKNL